MPSYLLLEDGGRLVLEDDSGNLLLEESTIPGGFTIAGAASHVRGVIEMTLVLEGNGTFNFSLPRSQAACIQVTGTLDGGTLELLAGPDELNFFALPTAVSFVDTTGVKALALADLAFLNYQISLSGGTAPEALVTIQSVMQLSHRRG